MPLFEYRCHSCTKDVELLIRSEERPVCPACGSHHLDKLLSAAAAPASNGQALPIAGGCPPSDAPPCSPHCCRL